MMNANVAAPPKPCPPVADTHAKRSRWWLDLEPQWRAAFGLAFFRHTDPPTPDELESLWQTPALRFAGPRAPYPNLNFELTNGSGLAGMRNLEILVLMNHRLESLPEVADMPQLKSLFVNNNALKSLHGIEQLTHLEQLYAQVNQLESIEPIRDLVNLREVYVSLNPLKTLDGLTRRHATAMQRFVCLPNEQLPDRVTLPLERKLGIRIRSI